MDKVVVFSPSRYSLYTICAVELLRRNGVEVAAIFVRRLLNPARFLSEFRRDGARLLRKIWRKLVLRQHAAASLPYDTWATFMKREQISRRSVEDFAADGIPVFYCQDLNEPAVLARLEALQPRLAVFTGGGLLRAELLKRCGEGVLNCHAGILPRYRGMDVIEWAILEGQFDQVGCTVHFMDQGVDTGDILRIRPIDLLPGDELRYLRDRFEPLMCQEIVAACLDVLQGRAQRLPQPAEAGHQYFIMHPALVRLAQERLVRFLTARNLSA
jgi:folate-dependent phosphoribosylglycinamide formyltransferase PurN